MLNRQSMVRIVSNPEPEPSWIRHKFMSFNKAVRSGALRSAWDDYDSEADAFAGRKSSERVEQNRQVEEDMKRLREEREEARRKQEEKMRIAREQEAARRAEEAQNQLEALEGFGSF